MSWIQAKNKILKKIVHGTDLNSVNTTYRIVLAVRQNISSARYGYKNETGFAVQIGKNNSIFIPISMLEKCFGAFDLQGNYDGNFFRNHFPLQAKDHPCHVHTVGQMFVVAGVARRTKKHYHL